MPYHISNLSSTFIALVLTLLILMVSCGDAPQVPITTSFTKTIKHNDYPLMEAYLQVTATKNSSNGLIEYAISYDITNLWTPPINNGKIHFRISTNDSLAAILEFPVYLSGGSSLASGTFILSTFTPLEDSHIQIEPILASTVLGPINTNFSSQYNGYLILNKKNPNVAETLSTNGIISSDGSVTLYCSSSSQANRIVGKILPSGGYLTADIHRANGSILYHAHSPTTVIFNFPTIINLPHPNPSILNGDDIEIITIIIYPT